jgi:hypothetical protein
VFFNRCLQLTKGNDSGAALSFPYRLRQPMQNTSLSEGRNIM